MKASDKVLAGLFLSYGFAGLVEGAAPVDARWPDAFVLFHILLIAFLLFAWCGKHAEENRVVPPVGAKPLVAFLAPVGVPYYFLARYGVRQGGMRTAKAILEKGNFSDVWVYFEN